MSIFAHYAPLYWQAGLPAIPLIPRQKRPAINRWQVFSDAFPTEDERNVWLAHFPEGNIGLPMGPASGLVAIDIDTDDQTVLGVLNRVLPASPWTRVGKKGAVRIYRYNNERTVRIKDADGNMICEILSKGTQFVLPPSMHPDTGKPYTADAELWEVHRTAPVLPKDVEVRIREALKAAGIEVAAGGGRGKVATFVPAGARDSSMVSFAGLMSRAVLKGERTLREAVGEMTTWVDNFVEKVSGDDLSPDKAVAKLIEFLVKDVTGGRALPKEWDEGLTDADKEQLGISFTDEQRQWSRQEIVDSLCAAFAEHGEPNSSEQVKAWQVALHRAAVSNLSPLDLGIILKQIVSQSKNTLSISDLRKQVNEIKAGPIEGDSHREIAEEAFQRLSRFGEIRHDGQFWQWKGAHWSPKPREDFLNFVGEEYGGLKICKRASDYEGVVRVIKTIAESDVKIGAVRGMNFANGFLDEHLELRAHHPDLGMTYVFPYQYAPEKAEDIPLFRALLTKAWGDEPDFESKFNALQEAFGASLMQVAPRYQRAFLSFGEASSGKSTCVEILKGLLPPNAYSTIPPSDWKDKFLPAAMHGKAVNFAGELSETRYIAGDIFKLVVEGAEITAQHKNQPPFQFRPVCAQWFNSNHLPKTMDTSDGFYRRLLVFDWPKVVPPADRVPDYFKTVLEHEADAIIAWSVVGYSRLVQQGGYTVPSSHTRLIEQAASQNNSVRYFLGNDPQLAVGLHTTKGQVSCSALFDKYWRFCLQGSIPGRVDMRAFHRRMQELKNALGFEILGDAEARQEPIYVGVEIRAGQTSM